MKIYNYTKRVERDTDADLSSGKETIVTPPETPFARAALEWNNALSIAAEKMWGD